MSFTLPFTAPPTVEVFAVEDTTAQLVWRRLPAGELTALAHHRTGAAEHPLGRADEPGAADLLGFEPDTTTRVEIRVDGRPIAERMVTTAPTIDDGPITKIATISDLHLGEEGFGLVRQFRESRDVVPYPLRCALAAVKEAEAWGAELLVIKGDITELGKAPEWELFDALLSAISIPVVAVPGNHDTVAKRDSVDATVELQQRGLFPAPVHHLDLANVRVVLADSTVPKHSWGRLGRHRDALVDAVAIDRPAMIFTHHHLEDRRYPWFWPLGIQRFDNAGLVRDLAETNPDLLISSGHTHRTRVRFEAGIAITEVGSTKDGPGVWAGYTVHDHGVRQVVRRVAEPSCVSWTDRTHAVVAGIWGRWSPGRLADRSMTHRWPSGGRMPATTANADQTSSPVPSERV
ncbi:MAG: metallophosphoesterase [Actinomycetota bacterium]